MRFPGDRDLIRLGCGPCHEDHGGRGFKASAPSDNRSYEETEQGLSKVVVKMINITETGVQLRGWVWASDPSSGFDMKCDLLKSIKHRFDEENISLAYPQRVIYIRENTQDKKLP